MSAPRAGLECAHPNGKRIGRPQLRLANRRKLRMVGDTRKSSLAESRDTPIRYAVKKHARPPDYQLSAARARQRMKGKSSMVRGFCLMATVDRLPKTKEFPLRSELYRMLARVHISSRIRSSRIDAMTIE